MIGQPDETISFSRVPTIKPLPIVDMSKQTVKFYETGPRRMGLLYDNGQCAKRQQWRSMVLCQSSSIQESVSHYTTRSPSFTDNMTVSRPPKERMMKQ